PVRRRRGRRSRRWTLQRPAEPCSSRYSGRAGRQLVDDRLLVERMLGRAANLIGLVPFAGEQDDVAGRRDLQSARDGRAAILDAFVFAVHAGLDLVENLLGI